MGAVAAWLMFFLGVFLTLMTMLVITGVSDAKPDLTIAYRIVGLTAGCTAFILAFVASIIYDVRRAGAARST